jgi:hypothetical protein
MGLMEGNGVKDARLWIGEDEGEYFSGGGRVAGREEGDWPVRQRKGFATRFAVNRKARHSPAPKKR